MTEQTGPSPDEKSREDLEAEVEELRTELASRKSDASTRVRGATAFILVILSALAVTAAAVGWWARSVAFDTTNFMEVVEPAVTSQEFKVAVGTRVGEETVTALDLETRLTTRLTAIDQYLGEQLIEALGLGEGVLEIIERIGVPRFADLAGPLSQAANERIESAIQTLVASDAFEATLLAAVSRGHEATVALIEDDLESLENVYVDGSEVKWNVLPLVVAAIEHVIEQRLLGGDELTLPDLSDNPAVATAIARLSEALGVEVPEDAGQVTIMSTDDLGTLQTYGATITRAVWLLVALALVLIAITIAVSPRRRRTLIQLAVATVIALVLAGIIVRAVVGQIQESIASPETRAAAAVLLGEVWQSARQVGAAILIIAALVAIIAWLAGRPEQIDKWLASARQATDPDAEPNRLDQFVGRYFDVLAIVLVVITLVVVWIVDLTWVSGLVILAVLAGVIWYGMSARARYEFDEGIDELEEEAAETAQAESR